MRADLISGILFDKDGTLFDFHATWRGTVERILAELTGGDPAQTARLGAVIGFDSATGKFAAGSLVVAGSTGEIAEALAAQLSGWSAARIEQIANAAALAAGELAPAADDLPGLLDRLTGLGMALGVATHDAEAAARRHLDAVGALDRFDFVCGYDSGAGLKPGPGMLRAFCEAVSLPPEQVAVVGDSLHDLHMARAGGAGLAIGVLTGPAGREVLAGEADLVLASISGLEALFAGA